MLPILLYGCEVWGFTNLNMLELVHKQPLRNISKLRKSTPEYMLYADLGRVPIEMHVKSRMIGYWISIINGCEAKYCKKIYNLMKIEVEKGKVFKWLNYIKQILISVGMPDLLNQPFINNPKATKTLIKTILNDIYLQEWHAKLQNSSKVRAYSIFKQNLNFETYLNTLNKSSYRCTYL